MMTKIKVLSLVAGAVALLPLGAMAQDYPTRPVTIVVPFSPGGPGDLTARFVAEGLSTELGQPFVVENHPGANGVLGHMIFGTLSYEDALHSLELFASEVMPEFQHDAEQLDWKEGVLAGEIELSEIDTSPFTVREAKKDLAATSGS